MVKSLQQIKKQVIYKILQMVKIIIRNGMIIYNIDKIELINFKKNLIAAKR